MNKDGRPTLAERFSLLIESECRGNQTAFAKKLGIPQSTLSRILKTADEKAIMDHTGRALLAFPNLNRSWLLSGQGEKYFTTLQSPDSPSSEKLREETLRLTKALESERAEKLRLMSMNEQLTKEVLQFNQFLRERFGWDEEMEGKPDVFHYGLPDSAHATKKLVRGVDTPDNDSE